MKHLIDCTHPSHIENLYSISSVQEEIEVAATYYHSLGQEEKIEAEGFTIIDEVHDCLELFDRLNETLTTSWDIMFDVAKAYYDEFGDLDVPLRYANRKSEIRNGYLTDERIAALDQLGMCWDVLDYLFEQNYAAAVEYHRTHGNLDVPAAYVNPDGYKLGGLVSDQREKYRAGKMKPERKARLDALGMPW